MNRVAWNVDKNGFQKNFEKNFDLENFRLHANCALNRVLLCRLIGTNQWFSAPAC